MTGLISQGAVGPCPGGCPGTRLDVARVNVQVWIRPFCGGLTVADITLPAAIKLLLLLMLMLLLLLILNVET